MPEPPVWTPTAAAGLRWTITRGGGTNKRMRFWHLPASLYTLACNFFEDILKQDATSRVIGLCTIFVKRTVMLAAMSILLIHCSSLAPFLDLNAGEQAYFRAILFYRQTSLESGDLWARGVSIFTQLWTSQNVLRRPHGQVDSLATKIRSRVSMSVVYDWFGGAERSL